MMVFVVGTISPRLFLNIQITIVNSTTTSQYPTVAVGPFYSMLNKSNIKEVYQLEIPYWKELLLNCLNILNNLKKTQPN